MRSIFVTSFYREGRQGPLVKDPPVLQLYGEGVLKMHVAIPSPLQSIDHVSLSLQVSGEILLLPLILSPSASIIGRDALSDYLQPD